MSICANLENTDKIKCKSLTNTCSSRAIIGTRFLSVPEDLQSWVTTDTIFTASVAVSCAVNLMGKNVIHFVEKHSESTTVPRAETH